MALDAEPEDTSMDQHEGSSGFDEWRRDSALGAIGTGIARGLHDALAPPVDEMIIVASVPGDPPDGFRVRVILDPEDPTKSFAIVPRKSVDPDSE
jgi:hypothetical protein